MVLWKCALENEEDLCVNKGQELSEYRVSPNEKERKKEGEKSIFDSVWFSMWTAPYEGAAMCSGSISLVCYNNDS